MAVRRDKDGRWRYRKMVRLPEGTKMRISGCPTINTRLEAEREERAHIERALRPAAERKEVPTFAEWFTGRYWREWVVGRKNKPSSMEGKQSIYKHHLEPAFGRRRLNEIGVAQIASFRASLIEKNLSDKTVNNILAVLSKPLYYAADVELIVRAPKVGLLPIEAPEMQFWEFADYARILAAARRHSATSYAAICLAGEAGLRVGEVKGLRWREDVDIIAKTITVNQQLRRGVVGTPKGRTRRTLPMTETLFEALRRLEAVREGLVIRNLSGQAKNDENQLKNLIYRICRLAGLPERGWHVLRHTFGTHSALFGANPWRLMTWMGHKRIEQTMGYVHVAEAHMRDVPAALLEASTEQNPDRRILKMLGARVSIPTVSALEEVSAWQKRGKSEKANGDSVGLSST